MISLNKYLLNIRLCSSISHAKKIVPFSAFQKWEHKELSSLTVVHVRCSTETFKAHSSTPSNISKQKPCGSGTGCVPTGQIFQEQWPLIWPWNKDRNFRCKCILHFHFDSQAEATELWTTSRENYCITRAGVNLLGSYFDLVGHSLYNMLCVILSGVIAWPG